MASFFEYATCENGLGVIAFLASFTTALWVLYQYLLPKPLPGIPYNPEALTSILGDVPDLMRDDRGAMDWLLEQSLRHQRPICQVFLRPFSKPFVLLSDFRESEDILMRRKEWDRSDYSIDLLGGQAPYHHINQKTGPVWKAHRRLIQDLMLPEFLNNVAAPNIYSSTLDLIQLWTEKERLSGGRPFCAEQDIFYASLDAVLEFSFGASFPYRAIPPQRDCIETLTANDLGATLDGAIEFPSHPVHQTIKSTLRASEVVGELVEAPFPRLSWWLKSWMPAEAKHVRIRHHYVKEQIFRAVDRLESENDGTDDAWVKSAVDLMIKRERELAVKEGRASVYWSPTMRDEVFGFVIGGHDTLSTTILWGLKFLSDNPYVQGKLRKELRERHPKALECKRMPTAQEITKNGGKYLDATIQEILRLASSIAILDRQTSCDTELLGHHIPKGTILMMLNRGPSFTEPALPVDESLRSSPSQASISKTKEWLHGNEDMFIPDRWLKGIPQPRLSYRGSKRHPKRDDEGPPNASADGPSRNQKSFESDHHWLHWTAPDLPDHQRVERQPTCAEAGPSNISNDGSSSNDESHNFPPASRNPTRGAPSPIRKTTTTQTGPSLPFGLGQRGCYGKKLAMLELKIVFTLLMWNFELGKCPEELSGYAAVETLTHKPRQCFVRLRKLDGVE